MRLDPEILHNTQKYIAEKLGDGNAKPVSFVFHGGSGSSVEDIRYAIKAGVIKVSLALMLPCYRAQYSLQAAPQPSRVFEGVRRKLLPLSPYL